jgi:hypothetical protein
MDQGLTHGDRVRMLVGAIAYLLDGRADYDPGEPLSIMRAVCLRAGLKRFAPVTLTSLACAEIVEADVADLYAACSEAAPKLREARR